MPQEDVKFTIITGYDNPMPNRKYECSTKQRTVGKGGNWQEAKDGWIPSKIVRPVTATKRLYREAGAKIIGFIR